MQIKMNQVLHFITNSLDANLLNPVWSPSDRLVEAQLQTTSIYICWLITGGMLCGYNLIEYTRKKDMPQKLMNCKNKL